MSDTEKKTQNSSSFERRVVGYLRPCVAAKFEKYVAEHGGSKSEHINDAISRLVEPMPSQQRVSPK